MNLLLLTALTALAVQVQEDAPALARLDVNLPCQGSLSEPVTYKVDLQYVVTPPYHTKTLKVWLPLPPSDKVQTVSDRELSTFPLKVEPNIGTEKLHGNTFAYFEFDHPQGAQIIRHKFTIKTHEVRWNIDAAKVRMPDRWPDAFTPYLRSERLIVVDQRIRDLLREVVPERRGPVEDLAAAMAWVNANLKYNHGTASLQASAVHALERRAGHCSDYHGLCAAFGRSLGFPARVAYGINPLPKNSPSHCKLEAFLPPYGWVAFDVSETQQLMQRIGKETQLTTEQKAKLTLLARQRLEGGFRDNTWFLQTRGTDYDLVPPAQKRVAVVRTIYAEADGEALPEPDPADPAQRRFAWMSVHHYVPDRPVTNPFSDWRSLERP